MSATECCRFLAPAAAPLRVASAGGDPPRSRVVVRAPVAAVALKPGPPRGGSRGSPPEGSPRTDHIPQPCLGRRRNQGRHGSPVDRARAYARPRSAGRCFCPPLAAQSVPSHERARPRGASAADAQAVTDGPEVALLADDQVPTSAALAHTTIRGPEQHGNPGTVGPRTRSSRSSPRRRFAAG